MPEDFDLLAHLSRMEAPSGLVYEARVSFDVEAAPAVRERRSSYQTLADRERCAALEIVARHEKRDA